MSYIIPVKHERDSLFEWKSPLQLLDGFGHKNISTKGDFEVELDVSSFAPHEIDVRVNGREVKIHCLHEDENNRREVNRSYHLPDDVDANTVKSQLNRGTLVVTAARKNSTTAAQAQEHRSPIQSTLDKFGMGSLLGGGRKYEFEVELDVHNFEPHEIDVKVVGREVTVNCHHEGKEFGQVVKREINRSYRLPDDIDPNSVRSHLSHNRLTINASKKHF